MLRKLIASLGANRRGQAAELPIREAIGAWAAGDLRAARDRLDKALADFPDSQGARYWSGQLALVTGLAPLARDEFQRVLATHPAQAASTIGLANAFLLAGDEGRAFELYCQALPEVANVDDPPDGGEWPYRHAHPIWLSHISAILPPPLPDSSRDSIAPPADIVAQSSEATLVNFASLLCRRNMASKAAPLLERALVMDPDCGQAAAALALFRCLNHDWEETIVAALAARRANKELWQGCNEACMLAAAIETGLRPGEIDRFADWSGLNDSDAPGVVGFDSLPAFQFDTAAKTRAPLTLFVACDHAYFTRYAIALVLSIRQASPTAQVHLHLFGPPAGLGDQIARLKTAIAPMQIEISHESVDFDKHGGKGTYCQSMRFARLHQWMEIRQGTVAMLDADSLVRDDLVPQLASVRDAAFILEKGEPPWHRHPAGLTVFRPTPSGRLLLKRLAALMTANASAGNMPYGLDQLALYVLAHEANASADIAIDMLDGSYCDTQFNLTSRVWSITQDKEGETPFALESRRLLAEYSRQGPALHAG